MVRSNSHPPEMWGRELSTDSANLPDPYEKLGLDFLRKPSLSYNLPEVSSATQTEDCDYETIHRIVRSNLRLVLQILGKNLKVQHHKMSLSTIEELSRENLCDMLTEENQDSNRRGSVSSIDDHQMSCSNNNEETSHRHIKPMWNRHRIEKHVSIVETETIEVDNNSSSSCVVEETISQQRRAPIVTMEDDGSCDNITLADDTFVCDKLNYSYSNLVAIDDDGSRSSGEFEFSHGESCVIVLNEDDIDVEPDGNVKKRYNSLIIKKAPLSNRFSAGDADKLEKGVVPAMPSTRSLKEM